MTDLSPKAASERAAEASCEYYAICWRNTFPDTASSGWPSWSGQTDSHRLSAIRTALVTIYSYLHFRSERDPNLETERMIFLAEIEREWRPILARTIGCSQNDLEARKPRRAWGADLSNPVNDLLAFAVDQEMSAGLLLEAYRREEVRRLNCKAELLKRGPLSESDARSDASWAQKNAETFEIAEMKVALGTEARELTGPASHDR